MLADIVRRILKINSGVPLTKAHELWGEIDEKSLVKHSLGDEKFFVCRETSNGFGGYRMIDLYLLKESDRSFCCCIIDSNGKICNFPGFVEGAWKRELEYPLDNKVRFAFWLYGFKDGTATVSWTLQPDGRYFEDEDGFGAEKFCEITLYSSIDENGNFICPFKA